MPRIPRSYLPPVGIYHVTILGVNSTPIVRDDRDRLFLLGLFAREIVERQWRVVAWCLLDTHLHFIVECVLASLSAGMQRMNGTHAQAFNRRHDRHGHLFGDRFSSTVVVDDDHLRNAIAYVLALSLPGFAHYRRSGRGAAPNICSTRSTPIH
jgi:REP element-mobilizing transposase RayT